jgi:hypothetical protein
MENYKTINIEAMNTSVKCWILMFCFVVFPLAQLNAQTAKVPPAIQDKEFITYNNPTKWMIIYLELDSEVAIKVNSINSLYLNRYDSLKVAIHDKAIRIYEYDNIQEDRLFELQKVLNKSQYEKIAALFEQYKAKDDVLPKKE